MDELAFTLRSNGMKKQKRQKLIHLHDADECADPDDDANDREDAAFEKKLLIYNFWNHLGWRTSYRRELLPLPHVVIARLRRKKEVMTKGGLDASRDLPATSRRPTRGESIRRMIMTTKKLRSRIFYHIS